ncbi:MAG: aminopeptidase P family protein [Ignavibacteriaceae bacterium]|jgi:Xaa-Pro aminopeptidase|nr:aminopeptidase P family protein [Chlorobium sp.]MCW8817203.1 aminopeptidase P family protein [Ignavibacteriaceae bacterium]MCW8823658.1 aminopeptidase P family protein [Ignavibacteriaceae bacterium]MCW8961414.1 aminopeptidase P family protein [Ignavibacteriaceae bacterium]MCW9096992.1 aminopeptidase P family protein [Ignavibacteriaceae bacterium]
MFEANVYIERRRVLKDKFDSGIIIFLGNNDSPANYLANTYSFRQDSSFLYYYGIDRPGFAATIDIDNNLETLFGNDYLIDEIVWVGSQPTVNEFAEFVGIKRAVELDKLSEQINSAIKKGRKVHFLPQYRSENIMKLASIIGVDSSRINDYASEKFIKAIVAQRSIKSEEEIKEIDAAVDIAAKMHIAAMKMVKPDTDERKIAGMIEGIALSLGYGLSFRPIVSINGQTLHNPYYDNKMKIGDLLVNDSGAESKLHYASDITRTIPVGGKFEQKQKEIYEIVLKSEQNAIDSVKPGITFKDIHMQAATDIASGLVELGLMSGNPEDAVRAGAHTLFFPHGLGHMLGLDVHDMEGLGEDLVGYDESIIRSEEFGLKYLRLAKTLESGFVFTIEPGIYFIPELIDMWKQENKFSEYINYDKVEEYRNFGGIRIEDDVLVTEDGFRVLGSKPIPKSVEEIEATVPSK